MGLASLGVSGWANQAFGPVGGGPVENLLPVSFAATVDTATSVVQVPVADGTPLLEVTHAFRPSGSPYLYQVDVTIRSAEAALAADGDELFIPGIDMPLGGVDVALTGLDARGAPVTRAVTTATDGTYTIAALRAGNHGVTVPEMAGGGAVVTGNPQEISLSRAQMMVGVDFAYAAADACHPPTPATTPHLRDDDLGSFEEVFKVWFGGVDLELDPVQHKGKAIKTRLPWPNGVPVPFTLGFDAVNKHHMVVSDLVLDGQPIPDPPAAPDGGSTVDILHISSSTLSQGFTLSGLAMISWASCDRPSRQGLGLQIKVGRVVCE